MDRTTLLPIDKSLPQIISEIEKDLASSLVNVNSPGGIARLILAKVGEQLGLFYQQFTVQHAQVFLSQATGTVLDKIGELLNCTRRTDETNENYRYRISQQTLSLEQANETAIRLAVLSLPSVKDVVLKEFSHGTGSFSVYPVLDDPYEWNDTLVLSVQNVVNRVKAYGTKAVVLEPRILGVELRGTLVFDEKATSINKSLIVTQVTRLIREYVNERKPGEKLEVKKLIDNIVHSSESIIDIDIYHFQVNGRAALLTDQTCAWNERFAEALTSQAVLIS